MTAAVRDMVNTKDFSVIIDESTDRSTTKPLAVAVKILFIEKRDYRSKVTKFGPCHIWYCRDLFAVMKKKYEEDEEEQNRLCMESMEGFSADTTNVIFGCNDSIVTQIKEASPSCFILKYVCYSTDLIVSHASNVLPRTIDQLIRDIYNYFCTHLRVSTSCKNFRIVPTHHSKEF